MWQHGGALEKVAWTLTVIGSLSMAACGGTAHSPGGATNSASNVPTGDVLRLCGSATIGATLAPKLAVGYLTRLGARDVEIVKDDKKANQAIVRGTMDKRSITVEIDYPGSSAAFEGLRKDTCDVGLASRPIQDVEVETLQHLGDMTSPKSEHALAMDGIAVIVRSNNPLTQMSVAQIAKVFTGEIKNWSELGGEPGEIHLYARNQRSGTYETFAELALQQRPIHPSAKLFDDNEALSAAVSKDDHAIGFVGLASVGSAKVIAVQDGTAPASAPSAFSVATEEYPFSRRLFLYVSERIRPILAQRFVNFALGEDAESIVASAGFVPFTVNSANPTIPTDAPPAYVRATRGAHRLSFTFRFRGNGTTLDSRSLRDIGRLATFVSTSSHPRPVSLLAFTDAGGTVSLSRQRAQAIAGLLKSRGVATGAVEGFGPALAVASNDTKEGRRKNNRVEVWLP